MLICFSSYDKIYHDQNVHVDSLHLYFVNCSSSGSHKGLCFLVGDLK